MASDTFIQGTDIPLSVAVDSATLPAALQSSGLNTDGFSFKFVAKRDKSDSLTSTFTISIDQPDRFTPATDGLSAEFSISHEETEA